MSGERDELGRFTKGHSGNRKGRPKGSKNHRTWFLEVISEPVSVTINGKRRKLPKIAVMYMTHMNRSISEAGSAGAQSARIITNERDKLGVLDEFEKLIDFSKDSELLNTYGRVLTDPSVKPVKSDEEDDLSFLD